VDGDIDVGSEIEKGMEARTASKEVGRSMFVIWKIICLLRLKQ
jgi:hypothetical protein